MNSWKLKWMAKKKGYTLYCNMKEMGENNEKYTFRERKKFGLESLLLNMKTNQTNGRISYEKFLQRTPGGTQTWLQTFQIVEKEGG